MAKRKQPEPESAFLGSEFRVTPPEAVSGYKTERHVLTLLLGGNHAATPVISFHPDGDRTYLWVGDDKGGRCYGVTDGIEPLREFARALLAACGK